MGDKQKAVCQCPPTHKMGSDKKTCVKKHPCEINNGGCSHRCTRIKGFKAACQCPATHKLQQDKKTCVNKLCLEKDVINYDGQPGASSQHSAALSASRAFQVQGPGQRSWANKKGAFPATVWYKFAGSVYPNKLGFTLRREQGTFPSQAPVTFNIVASKDCKTWTTLLQVKNAGFTKTGQTKAWDIPCGKNVALYKCVGVQVIKSNGGQYAGIANIKMWGEQVKGVHPCDIKNGGCQRKCKKVGSKAVCQCPTTHKLAANKKKCIPKHPCEINKGGCSHTCKRNGAKALCQCPNNLKLAANKKKCIPKHPCEIKNGGCSNTCKQNGAKALCQCPRGSRLEKDQKTCKKIPAPVCTGRFNHAIGGKASSSTNYPKHQASDAFSGPTKSWHSKSGMPQWLRYELKQPRQVCKISFLPRLDNSFSNRQKDCPKHFEFQGSNNGRNFITLLTVKNQQCPASKSPQTITHTFKNNRAFKFYRVFIRNTPGRSASVKYVGMGNLQLFGNAHPCDTNNGKGPCSHICNRSGAKPVCACPPKLKLAADKKKCIPKHPCEINKGGCSHTCKENGAKALCQCPAGSRLKKDQKTC